MIPAAVLASRRDGTAVVVHLSTRLDDGRWVVELRRRTRRAHDAPVERTTCRSTWTLGTDAHDRTSTTPYLDSDAPVGRPTATCRSRCSPGWRVHGRPIRYGYVERPWPIAAYQNVYANEPGSAEMPSAGRPFTPEVITRLVAKGVDVAPLVLHTGVASLESTELPYPERLRVPAHHRRAGQRHPSPGGRVIAVGTTVVRGARDSRRDDGVVEPFDGWTDLVITPERGVRVVDGLLTGWHEPEASHLLMLEAVAGRELLERRTRPAWPRATCGTSSATST